MEKNMNRLDFDSAYNVMRNQGGGRMIVSFIIPCDGYSTRETSHYDSMEEVRKEWDRLIAINGKGVTASSDDPRFIQ